MRIIDERPTQKRRVLLAAAALLLGASLSIAGTSPAGAAPVKRICGTLPSESTGFINFAITRGVTCRIADRVSQRASRRFCRRHGDCHFGLHTSTLKVYRGRISYRSWLCRMKVGYETFSARCRKRSMHFYKRSAA